MTEEEYLELKEYLLKGITYAEELRNELFPPTQERYKLKMISFDSEFKMPELTEEQIKKRDYDRELHRKLMIQELDNELIVDMIRSYEFSKKINNII